ncbi:MAG: hypothetical protein IPO91_13215 [Chloroflexi bacterium]|nr:hypothetical protein [Chloroflexota bacterium]
MAPMEPWQRVWIDAETYTQDIHSYINCTDCHQGQAVDDMEAAHEGMIASPGAEAATTCGNCHTDVTPDSLNSLHSTLAGYDTAIYARSAPENHAVLEDMESYHCNNCHATCGDCHVSQPVSVGGGLLSGHDFVETPPMSNTCTACHGSRVKNEYYGLNEGLPADVHFRERMGCTDCHTGAEMHGTDVDAAHRYDGLAEPSCISCHEDQVGVGSGIEQHEIHGTETVSCQVCHSVAYTSCVNCHVERTEDDIPFYSIEEHSIDFYIGLNPLQNAERPYEYTTLRHVPIDIDSFSFYGDDLLSNFDARATWVYATPHNIQRNTPQTESCTSCHGNDEYFLTQAVVAAEELAANQSVMVDGAPPLPAEYADHAQAQPEEVAPAAGSDDGFWGDAPAAAATESSGDFWGEAPPATPAPADDFWGGAAAQPTTEATESADAFWGNS